MSIRLSTRLAVVVGIAALGTVILVLVALQGIRSSMLEDRNAQISQTLNLVKQLVNVYVVQEKSGKLSYDSDRLEADLQ